MSTATRTATPLSLIFGTTAKAGPAAIDLYVTPHILLIGRPGAGKTEAARSLAYTASKHGFQMDRPINQPINWRSTSELGLKSLIGEEFARRQEVLGSWGVSTRRELPPEVAVDSLPPLLVIIDDVSPQASQTRFSAAEIRMLELIKAIAEQFVGIHLVITGDLDPSSEAATLLSGPSWARVTMTAPFVGELEAAGAVTAITSPPFANESATADVERARAAFLAAREERRAARVREEAAQVALMLTTVHALRNEAVTVTQIQPHTGVSRALVYQWLKPSKKINSNGRVTYQFPTLG